MSLVTLPKTWVPGEGSLDYGAMVVGEAPGREEWEAKRPFIGASGKFLRKTLEGFGVDPADVYITNVVKFRPTDERDKDRRPTLEEIEECWPYFEEEVIAADPQCILVLGASSFNAISRNRNLPIGPYRGMWITWTLDGVARPYLPTYHPAATMYNPNLKKFFLQDVEKWLEGPE